MVSRRNFEFVKVKLKGENFLAFYPIRFRNYNRKEFYFSFLLLDLIYIRLLPCTTNLGYVLVNLLKISSSVISELLTTSKSPTKISILA